MFEHYIEDIRAQLAQLAAQPYTRELQYRFPLSFLYVANPKLREQSVNEFEEDIAAVVLHEEGLHDYRFPHVLRELGVWVTFLHFMWQTEPVCGKAAWGVANLPGLFEIYYPFDGWPNDGGVPLMLFERYNLFDHCSSESGVYTRFERDQAEPTLYYLHPQTGEYMRLRLTVAQYLDALRETRGLKHWQQLFIDDSRFQPDLATLELFQCQLRELFPDADLRRFER